MTGITKFLIPVQLHLVLSAFFFGFLAFWMNKKAISEVEKEKINEDKSEEQRKNQFSHKFPAIRRIPVFRSLVKWMYGEGWFYSLGLLAILLIGFILRFANLAILDPYIDEYSHLLAAKTLLAGGSSEYVRAKIVTYFAAIFYWIGNASSFYEYVFWARIPSAVFGTLTAVPLYVLARKISKNAAIISALLWALCPWAIGVSKTVREYAYYPFFILIFLFVLINFIESTLKKEKKTSKFYITIPALVLFLTYAVFIDYLSTLKIILPIFLIVILFFLIVNLGKLKSYYLKNKKSFLFLSAFASLFLFVLGEYLLFGRFVSFGIDPTLVWVDYFFGAVKTPMFWWTGIISSALICFFVFFGALGAYFEKNRYYFLYFSLFFALLAFFTYFFDRYNRPRYIFYALPFFTILVSASISAFVYVLKIISSKTRRIAGFVLIGAGILFIFNFQNSIYPAVSDAHGYVQPTNEYHSKMNSTFYLLESEIKDTDVFITTFGRVLQLKFNLSRDRIYSYSYTNESRFEDVEAVVRANRGGLMILDSRRNGGWTEGYPKKGNFMVGNATFETLQNIDEIQVYRWIH